MGKWVVQTKCHVSDIGAGMCLGPEFRQIAMSAMQSSAGLGSVPIIQPVHHINLGKKCFNPISGRLLATPISGKGGLFRTPP